MEYGLSDSSGTDDDLPPSHQNRGVRGGHMSANGRAIVGAMSYPKIQNDMEVQIHRLEQEAYSSVLRAFKAQSDAITWEKESLITELRKELRVSDEEHRELLSCVNADDIIRRIREWRQTGGLQTGFLSNAQLDVPVTNPTVSAPQKRQKTSQPIPSLPLGIPSPMMHRQPAVVSMQSSPLAGKKGGITGVKGKKSKPGKLVTDVSSMKSMQYASGGPSGRGANASRNLSGALGVECNEPPSYGPAIGQKVLTRWPEDNNFYEAVITKYNPIEGLHALVYDMGTDNETWEWVNLKEISPEDIKWQMEDTGINQPSGRVALGRGIKKSTSRGAAAPGAGRRRGTLKNQVKNGFHPSQNGTGKKCTGYIEILHTESLIKEVEKIFSTNHPDPYEIEKAKQLLKEHEQSLVDAITRLAEASHGENEDGEHQFSHGQLIDHNHGWRNRQYGGNHHGANYDDMATEAREGSDDDHMAGDGLALNYHI